MKDHRISITISSFDKATCKRFDLFLRSPYHNTSEKALQLGLFFLTHYPSFTSKKFTEESAFRTLFPERDFSKHELNRYMSKVSQLLDKFAALESLVKQPLIEGSLIESYYFNSWDKPALERAVKQQYKSLSKQEPKGSDNFFFTYLNRKLFHNSKMYETQKKEGAKSFIEASWSLQAYFLIEMFQSAMTLKHQYRIGTTDTQLPLISSGAAFVKANIDTVPVLVKLWYYAFRVSQVPSDITVYKTFKSSLKLNLNNIPAIDARNFSILLISALKTQMNQGRQRYLEERFDMHLLEIQEDWIIADSVISYPAFNSIIQVALTLGHIDWAKNFIESHQHFLLEDIRNIIVEFNEIKILFANKYYKQCLEDLTTIPFLDRPITLGIKRLQIKCLFELQGYDELFNSLHALTMYIHRMDAKLIRAKEANNQFVKVVKLLYNALENPDQESAEAFTEIRSIVQANPLLPEAEWVLTYLEEA